MKKLSIKIKMAKPSKAMSSEHMKEYAHMSPAMLKKHMSEEKQLVKAKIAKKKAK